MGDGLDWRTYTIAARRRWVGVSLAWAVSGIIGLPGETVSIHSGGIIYIDGKRLEETYPLKGKTNFRGIITLEPNQYFLLGDNRDVSERYVKFGYQLLGKVLFSAR